MDNKKYFKDQWGLWRRVVDIDALILAERPDECPKCGGDVDTDLVPEDDEINGKLWEGYEHVRDALPTAKERVEFDSLFHFVHVYAECYDGDCSWTGKNYGPPLFYNPTTNAYDLPNMLPYRLVAGVEARAEREAAEAAGQLALPL